MGSYNFKTIDMLIGCVIVGRNVKKYSSELIVIRPEWTPEFGDGLEIEAYNVIKNYYGYNPINIQRAATNEIKTMIYVINRKLSLFKVQIIYDFDDEQRRNWILSTLGFTRFLDEVKDADQESTVELLVTFRDNLTDELKGEIVEKGMAVSLIDELLEYADRVFYADLEQEGLKENTMFFNDRAKAEFENIYKKSMRICRIAYTFFTGDRVKQNHFSFSYIIKTMNNKRKGSKPEEEPTEE